MNARLYDPVTGSFLSPDLDSGAVEDLAGKPYILGANGPNAYDCSSTACYGIRMVANPKFGDYTSDERVDHVTTILNSSTILHPSSGAGVLEIKPINYIDSYTDNRGGTIYYREFNGGIINK